jgi:hypothetical protein
MTTIAYRDIPQIPRASYTASVDWSELPRHLAKSDPALVLEPDYQRGHVWDDAQRTAFVEYGLMGGEAGMAITTNCPGWMADFRGPYELIDGLQRVTAVMSFLRGEIPAFGRMVGDYTGRMPSGLYFQWGIMCLPTRAQVLKQYLLLNAGGIAHSASEIARVRALLDAEGAA